MTAGPDELRTERLILRPLTRQVAQDVVTGRRRPEWALGFPQAGDRTVARLWLAGAEATADPAPIGPWGAYEVWTLLGVCIGTAGFHGPPYEGEVEIGYGIAAGHRGRGLATEAAGALVDLARAHRVARVVGRVDAGNASSQRLLHRLGFHVVGATGPEVLMALPLTG